MTWKPEIVWQYIVTFRFWDLDDNGEKFYNRSIRRVSSVNEDRAKRKASTLFRKSRPDVADVDVEIRKIR